MDCLDRVCRAWIYVDEQTQKIPGRSAKEIEFERQKLCFGLQLATSLGDGQELGYFNDFGLPVGRAVSPRCFSATVRDVEQPVATENVLVYRVADLGRELE